MLLVASRGPVGGLQNALPPLVGFRAKRPPAGSRLRRGSKQDRAFDLFRIARCGVPIGQSIEEVQGVRDRNRSSQGITQRGGARRGASNSSASSACVPGDANATSWWSSRHGSNRGVGRSKARRARARCWRSNSSRPARLVLDVPPTLSARARLLDAGRIDKTDAHDARAAAVVALRHSKLRTVVREDHTAVLRLLAKRHHDLVAHRTRAICRLHTVLCPLVAGGLPTPTFGHSSRGRAASHPSRRRGRDRTSTTRRRAPHRGA